MLVLYKRWKNHNKIQLTKKPNGLEQSKVIVHFDSQAGATSRD